MATLAEARQAVAEALTTAGLPCAAYPPDTIGLPATFIDTATVAYDSGAVVAGFCTGAGRLSVISADTRNDRPGSMSALEAQIPAVLATITAVGGKVASLASGSASIGGQDVPALIYQIDVPVLDAVGGP